MIETPRLLLRAWTDSDATDFAALHADPAVMHDMGGPLDRAASDAKLARYLEAFARDGITRWAVIAKETGAFLGYTGLIRHAEHVIGPHHDIGWRLMRHAWGQGIATEAARAALDDAFGRRGLDEVLAYTAPDNLRSQAVMARLGIARDPSRDFTLDDERVGEWKGWVWVARRAH